MWVSWKSERFSEDTTVPGGSEINDKKLFNSFNCCANLISFICFNFGRKKFWKIHLLTKFLPCKTLREIQQHQIISVNFFSRQMTFQKSRDSRSVSRMRRLNHFVCPVPSWTTCQTTMWSHSRHGGLPLGNGILPEQWYLSSNLWTICRLCSLEIRPCQFPELDWEKSAKMHHLVLGAMHKQSRH